MKMVEAALIMPVTCLIIIALIGLMMTFYFELNHQIDENSIKRDRLYEDREVIEIRFRDRLWDVL